MVVWGCLIAITIADLLSCRRITMRWFKQTLLPCLGVEALFGPGVLIRRTLRHTWRCVMYVVVVVVLRGVHTCHALVDQCFLLFCAFFLCISYFCLKRQATECIFHPDWRKKTDFFLFFLGCHKPIKASRWYSATIKLSENVWNGIFSVACATSVCVGCWQNGACVCEYAVSTCVCARVRSRSL